MNILLDYDDSSESATDDEEDDQKCDFLNNCILIFQLQNKNRVYKNWFALRIESISLKNLFRILSRRIVQANIKYKGDDYWHRVYQPDKPYRLYSEEFRKILVLLRDEGVFDYDNLNCKEYVPLQRNFRVKKYSLAN